MNLPGLAARNVSVSLGGRRVVEGATFAVEGGEFVAIVGPNGAGKTTLIRALAGLVPAVGEITLDEVALSTLAPQERACLIGYLPQGHVFHWPLTVAEVVGLGRLPHTHGAGLGEIDRSAVELALAETGTAAYRDRAVTSLSGGERARVALARVLATEAPIILADEPTASLDPHYQIAIMAMLRRHAEAFGVVVAVLHDLALAARFVDRVLVMDSGRIVADGAPREVLTAERMRTTFAVEATVIEVSGSPVIVPLGLSDKSR